MAEATIPVDLLNPGQVFASLGILELAASLAGGATGGFSWGDGARLHVRTQRDAHPIRQVLDFLAAAEVQTLVPEGSQNSGEKWTIVDKVLPAGAAFPFPDPPSPATLPAELRVGDAAWVIDHWGDATGRDNVKFWAGSGGYPGAALLRDALELARPRMDAADPFAVSAPQSSSFRFDWRRDYVPLGIGFSLNAHQRLEPRGYPLVEVLAAIGLTHARPARPERRNKLLYRYGVLDGADLPIALHRAALGCATLPFPARTFRVALDWPGQEGQARCITDITEEPRS